ncbi:MAG TPA: hypothetical protein VK709_02190 [Candidatus Saccharimonadales bacterium]|jgi:hypothetical protein|nr:hypothetical protein [Candidatus Saccharimonadales bacterium]
MRHFRNSITFVLLLPLIFGQVVFAQDKTRSCPEPTESSDSKFRPGQVWQYKTRPNDDGSTLTILKIETLPKQGVIIHIRIDRIRIRNCKGGPEPDELHMPFTRHEVERSVTKLVKEGIVPDFQAGYDAWKNACGGVYTTSVADAVQGTEDGFRNRLGCGQGG